MSALDNRIPGGVDQLQLGLCGIAKQGKDYRFGPCAEAADNFVRKDFPPAALVGKRLARSQCKDSIQQQDALLRPRHQTPVVRSGNTEVGFELSKHVPQGRREFTHSRVYGEAESVSHTFAGVRILTEQQNPHLIVRGETKRCKDLVVGRINLKRKSLALVVYELRQAPEVGLIEFRSDYGVPRWGNLNIHPIWWQLSSSDPRGVLPCLRERRFWRRRGCFRRCDPSRNQ